VPTYPDCDLAAFDPATARCGLLTTTEATLAAATLLATQESVERLSRSCDPDAEPAAAHGPSCQCA